MISVDQSIQKIKKNLDVLIAIIVTLANNRIILLFKKEVNAHLEIKIISFSAINVQTCIRDLKSNFFIVSYAAYVILK